MPVKDGKACNPTGKGGFGDHPENRNVGRPKTTFRELFDKIGDSNNIKVILTYNSDGEKKKIVKQVKAPNQKTMKEVLASIMYLSAINGHVSQQTMIKESSDGKITQPIEHSGSISGLSKEETGKLLEGMKENSEKENKE